jgi:2'-deoxynucleoside 5'-phosphate N-hydrolase
MKIYFCGSIRGGRQLASIYASLVSILSSYGQVLTEHVGERGKIPVKDRFLTDGQIYMRDMEWLQAAEVVVAEVTVPSLGVGYELGRAHDLGKPVLCLFNRASKRKLSAIIAGSPLLEVQHYASEAEFTLIIDDFISRITGSTG